MKMSRIIVLLLLLSSISIACQKRTISTPFIHCWGGTGNSVHISLEGNINLTGYSETEPNVLLVQIFDSVDQNMYFFTTLGSDDYIEGYDIITDDEGYVYVVGQFSRDLFYNNGTDIVHVDGEFTWDTFLVKFSQDGQVIWLRRWPEYEYLDQWSGKDFMIKMDYSLDIDNTGNIYVTGYYHQTIDIDPGIATSRLTSAYDKGNVFLSSFTSDGLFRWATSLDATLGQMAVDNDSNIFITGESYTEPEFYTSNSQLFYFKQIDSAYLNKFDSNGSLINTITWRAVNDRTGSSPGKVRADALTIDQFGNIYVLGSYEGYLDFNNGERFLGDYSSELGFYLAKFSNDGGLLSLNTWANDGAYFVDFDKKIRVDGDNNIYLLLDFNGSLPLEQNGQIKMINPIASLGQDVLLCKFNAAMELEWVNQWGGGLNNSGINIVIDKFNNIYITGVFGSFDPFQGKILGNEDWESVGYLIKVQPDGNW